ncbi:hypothetical protein J1614_005490 [Plenodomus biglobosus]|nr:hypothetical protein J1614_005490 [Plenodomus biglobosus]
MFRSPSLHINSLTTTPVHTPNLKPNPDSLTMSSSTTNAQAPACRSACNPPFNNDIYLELGLATITNEEWYHIMCTNGDEAWMRDSSLNMALEVLSQDTKYADNHIAILNSNLAQTYYLAGLQETQEAGEEAQVVKGEREREEDGESAPNDGFNEDRARLQNAHYIFLPLNDGFGAESAFAIQGTHWFLLALDMPNKCIHYYDSLGVTNPWRSNIAYLTALGMVCLLRQNMADWHFFEEHHSPSQVTGNQCAYDIGPCAPFVWRLVSVLAGRVLRGPVEEEGAEGAEEEATRVDLRLESGFEAAFWFDSWLVRGWMQKSILQAKAKYEHKNAERVAGATTDQTSSSATTPVLTPPSEDDFPSLPPASGNGKATWRKRHSPAPKPDHHTDDWRNHPRQSATTSFSSSFSSPYHFDGDEEDDFDVVGRGRSSKKGKGKHTKQWRSL